jgi:glutamate-ammonia-ligase adenylyltransferase
MLANYYECWAATWEKAVFMKARPVAGDRQLGWRVIRAIDPMIYRSAMDYESVAAVKELKDKIERTQGKNGDTFHVKLGSGGIRDVESVAQALQLLHGGRIPQVRGRSTETALVTLAEVGLLSRPDANDLLVAYRFLRRTENRLQMVAERQTHTLPKDRGDLERLARSMGFTTEDPVGAFHQVLEHHRARAHQIFENLFEEARTEHVLTMFERQVPQLLSNPITRQMMKDLAAQFGREIEAASDPLRAINNLERFIQGVGTRRFYYELLLDRPEITPRLVALFAASEYLSGHLASYPRLIEPIFDDPNVFLLPRTDLEKNFEAIRQEMAEQAPPDDAETELEAMRLAHHREVVNVGLLDLGGKVSRADAEAALTDIAEICLARSLSLATSQIQRQGASPHIAEQTGEFLVVAMGKLASREMTYGSDLDVIFLYDVEDADEDGLLYAQEYFVRLAQKLIWALRTRTHAGICYDIDARLRPSGNQGMLVVSLVGFERYHATRAQVWERQALLRARPVAGSDRPGRAFEKLRRRILSEPVPDNLGHEVHRIRARMESELARETTGHYDFKTGRGGMHDIEAVVQFLQLRHGKAHDQLFDVQPIATQLGQLERLALLDRADALVLRHGWEFLQRLSARLRIVENRSISDLDEERGDLDALARGLGYTSRQRAGGARRALLDHYRHHTGAIREVYCKILEVESYP